MKWTVIFFSLYGSLFLFTNRNHPLMPVVSTLQTKPTGNPPAFDKEGHRGCRGLMPENTVAAMYRALELGVTTLEMDVVITADGEAILSHEPFMSHEITTKPGGEYVTEAEEKSLNIYTMPYSEVVKYDVGLKPHPRFPQQQKRPAVKPRLSEVIDSVYVYCRTHLQKMPRFNIETKCTPQTDNIYHPAPDVFVEKIMAVVRKYKIEKQVIIQSFDFRSLQYLHKKYPKIATSMLVEEDDKRSAEQLLKALGFKPKYYSPHYGLVNAALVAFCKKQKIQLVPWTVNDRRKIAELRNLGVDGIITDYPNLFAEE